MGWSLKTPGALSDAEAAPISEIARPAPKRGQRVKLYDKKAALDAIARHLGMFVRRPGDRRRARRTISRRMRVRCLHASWLASLPEALRNRLIAALSRDEARALLYDWPFWAGTNQLPPPGDWRVWLLLAGRGFGKTRTGAELVRARVTARTARRIALVAPTAADARDVMVEGESGMLGDLAALGPAALRAVEAAADLAQRRDRDDLSADEPERLRGPQHDAAWCDELASWRYPEAWDMLMFGLRLGDRPARRGHDDAAADEADARARRRPDGRGDARHHLREPRQSGAALSSSRSSANTKARGSAGRRSTPRSSTTCRAACGAAA